MTITRLHISTFLGIAVVAWAIALVVSGVPVSWRLMLPFGAVVTVLVLVGLAIEKWLWKAGWLHGWFFKRPNLIGTWRVELISDYVNPTTGLQIAPIRCYFGITQTLSVLQLHLMTPESESWLFAHSVLPSPNGEGYEVAGVYRNQPGIHIRTERSPMHRGALVLSTHGPSAHLPRTLNGEYWTDRKTTGRISATRGTARVYTTYADAHSALGQE